MARSGEKKVRKGLRQTNKFPTGAVSNNPSRGGGILRDLLKGMLFIAFVLAIKLVVESTTVGKQLHSMSYNLLQLSLSAERMPVTIVDISDLEPQGFNLDGQVAKATPRDTLGKIIEAITEHQPKAIGVDVDFSPEDDDYVSPHDPDFFQFCLDIQRQRGVPIFLGIRRTMTQPAAKWLGEDKYQGLAANIFIPKDSKRMLSELVVEGTPPPGLSERDFKPSKSMSVALAEAYGQEAGESPHLLQRLRAAVIEGLHQVGFIEKTSDRQLGPRLRVKDFLVDFSPLETIEPLRTIDPVVLRDQSQRQRFQGKVVMIGDESQDKARDSFVVPARGQPYSGVFLHACATYTLIKAPLYEVTEQGRLSIDIIFLLAILVTVTLIRLYYKNRSSEEVAVHRLQGFFTVLVVIVALVIGVVLAPVTRVMWDDFFLALTGIMFHPSIERNTEKVWQHIRRHTSSFFHRLVFKNGKSSE
jgi:CHASE2 domain-containing sensor protein